MAAPAAVIYRLNESCTSFTRHRRRRRLRARPGVDRRLGLGTRWQGRRWTNLFTSPTLTGANGDNAGGVPVAVDVTGMRRLKLMVTNAQDGASWDRASWGDPQLVCAK